MLNFKKTPNHTWIVYWVPANKTKEGKRSWKVEILKDGNVVYILQGTDLGALQNEVNRLSNHLE